MPGIFRGYDEEAILQVMESYNLGAVNGSCTVVSNVATKDVATQNISVALLTAKQHGVELVEDFVRQRLIKSLETGTFTVSYHATLRKNKALTLANLYKEKISLESNRKLVVKTDKDFLCVLIAAYEGGRNINLKNILKHLSALQGAYIVSIGGRRAENSRKGFASERDFEGNRVPETSTCCKE